jgi:hypothetical protein
MGQTSVMRIVKLGLLASVIVPLASAGPIVGCVAASLQVYGSSDTPCSIGSLIFSDFSYHDLAEHGGVPVPPNRIEVTPVDGPGGIGLDFTAMWSAVDGQETESNIAFTVSSLSGAPDILGTSAELVADVSSTAATATLTEKVCAGGNSSFCKSDPSDLYVLMLSEGAASGVSSATFTAPVSTITITKILSLVSETSGSATVSEIEQHYPTSAVTTTPEPDTVLLGIFGLLLIAGVRRFVRVA